MQLVARLGDKYQVDELAGKYEFKGHTVLTVPQALEIKEELETIDRLLKQLEEAAKTAQIGIIDLEELSEFTEPGDVEKLQQLQKEIQEAMRQMAEQQGLERGKKATSSRPKPIDSFKVGCWKRSSAICKQHTGRRQGPVVGEGAVELQHTKPYEFGDSVTHMDMPASMVNAMIRSGPGLPIRMKAEDIVIHRTRNSPKWQNDRADGYERIDALRRPVRSRQTHGAIAVSMA